MSEWWTYSLSDFLMFSPRTYYRLFELYNAAIWPAQLVAIALGVAILRAVAPRRSAGRDVPSPPCWRHAGSGWRGLSSCCATTPSIGRDAILPPASRSRRCSCSGPGSARPPALADRLGSRRHSRVRHPALCALRSSPDRRADRTAMAAGRSFRRRAGSHGDRDDRRADRGPSAALGLARYSCALVRGERGDAVDDAIA